MILETDVPGPAAVQAGSKIVMQGAADRIDGCFVRFCEDVREAFVEPSMVTWRGRFP
jgi:hypothetical protein